MTHGLSPGSIFANDFAIVRQLSAGGMGEVYVVRQQSTGRMRALKVMHQHLLSDAQARQRFEREAQVASRIESEHVVEVVASGVDASSNEPWIAMELLEGETLADVLRRRQRLSPPATRAVLEGICHALAAAHRVGIVHRDLKPQNIFVARTKRSDSNLLVKVLDFGIAMIAKGTLGARFTGEDMLGSPVWMAPEQFADNSLVSPQTDVWNLGLLVFALLTGKRFWLCLEHSAEPTAVMNEALVLPMPSTQQRAQELGVEGWLPLSVSQWCDRCLQRDPRERYADAFEAWTALASVIAFAPNALDELDAIGPQRVSNIPSPWHPPTISQPISAPISAPPSQPPSQPVSSTATPTPSPWIATGTVGGSAATYSPQSNATHTHAHAHAWTPSAMPARGAKRSREALLLIVGLAMGLLIPLAGIGVYFLVREREPSAAASAMPFALSAPRTSEAPLSYQDAVNQTTALLQPLRPRFAECRTATPQSGRVLMVFSHEGYCAGVTAIYPINTAQNCITAALVGFRGARSVSGYSVMMLVETQGQ